MTRRIQLGALAVALALTLAVALGFGTSFLRAQARTGTVALFITSRDGDRLPATTLEIHDAAGWSMVGGIAATDAPASPRNAPVLRAAVVAGAYDSVRLGGRLLVGGVRVTQGQVEPLLVKVDRGLPSDLYAGTDEFNLGVSETSGKLQPVGPFHLTDQAGRGFDNASLAGHETVLAAFHTTCHETCPIYTGLFLQLSRQAPPGVRLLEVTTDPGTDTPGVLSEYAARVGAAWTFGTGSVEELTNFWTPFGVRLSNTDDHASVLVVVDRHGYVRLARTGVPQVDTLPPALSGQLSAAGRAELGHGEGWGSSQVLDTLRSLDTLAARSLPGGSAAPAFTATDLAGKGVSLADFRGRPLVVNFWATYCTPCREELPLLQRATSAPPGVGLLLIDERDSGPAARSFLNSVGVTARSAADADGRLGNLYGVQVLPTTIFIRADGTIEGRYLGQLDARTLATHLSAISG